jgi:hypothetical protein
MKETLITPFFLYLQKFYLDFRMHECTKVLNLPFVVPKRWDITCYSYLSYFTCVFTFLIANVLEVPYHVISRHIGFHRSC